MERPDSSPARDALERPSSEPSAMVLVARSPAEFDAALRRLRARGELVSSIPPHALQAHVGPGSLAELTGLSVLHAASPADAVEAAVAPLPAGARVGVLGLVSALEPPATAFEGKPWDSPDKEPPG